MTTVKKDILIIGGGCSGAAAGIQAARMGADTLIVEETPWLGGMITAAGVSAFDGNKYAVGGGIFGQLRSLIEQYYGGPDKVFTGWISLTCFEPSVGNDCLNELTNDLESLEIWFESTFTEILKESGRVTGAIIKNAAGDLIKVEAKVVIEATEFGDVLKAAGAPYRLGRDSKTDTGEPDAPEKADDILQDITYCAILKKYYGSAPKVNPSPSYNPARFANSTSQHATTTDETILGHKPHDWESFINYAFLPKKKYLLNWPFHSNDYPTIIEIYEQPETRAMHFAKAKALTLDFVHYMQTELGHPEWGLALDEYPTPDKLPFIPYVRESRRVKGKYLMVEQDVLPASGSHRPPLRKDSIAVGDYFLDHHHSLCFAEPPEERLVEPLPANAPFQIPLNCLIPAEIKGLIAAEKSISVTHIVNGCTRLQPVVMLIGQAAGALAALAVQRLKDPDEVECREVQETLLNFGCQLFPYKDVWNYQPVFRAAQECALSGIYFDEPDHTFQQEKEITKEELRVMLEGKLAPEKITAVLEGFEKGTRAEAIALVHKAL